MICSTGETESVMGKHCPNCGGEMPDRLKFCVSCGQKLPSEPAPSSACTYCEPASPEEPALVPIVSNAKEAALPNVSEPVSDEISAAVPAPPAAADVISTTVRNVASDKAESVKKTAHFCSACGKALPSGALFCFSCGHKVDGTFSDYEDKGQQDSVSNTSGQQVEQEEYIGAADQRVKNILDHYGTKRMLLKKLPFVVIMLVIAFVVIPILGVDDEVEVVNMLSGCVLAFMMWRVYRQPARYTAKRKKALMGNGYGADDTKRALSDNPIFGRKTPMEAGKAKRLADFGVFVGLIGMLLWFYGLFAFLLPVISCIIVPHDFNLLLFGKGLHIFTVGLVLSYTHKIVKGLTRS